MATIKARIKDGKFIFNKLTRLVAPEGYRRIAQAEMKKALMALTIRDMKRRIESKSGELAKSLGVTVEFTEKGLTAAVWSKAIYAGVIEEGTAAHPIPRGSLKGKKYMAIPLFLEGNKKTASPWDYEDEDTFTLPKEDADEKVMFWRPDGEKKPIPIFLLKKRIEIEARPFMSPAIEATLPAVIERVQNAIQKEMRRRAG
jgi:hypothetical protein